jgi:hypothetical protein
MDIALDLNLAHTLVAGPRLTPSMMDLAEMAIAPVAALVGVWLGSVWSTKTEERRWQRDIKAAAYLDALREIEAFRSYVISRTAEELDQMADDKDALYDLFRPKLAALTGLRIHGSRHVNLLSDKAVYYVIKYAGAKSDKREELQSHLWDALEDLIDACRADLHFQPLGPPPSEEAK